MNKSPKCRKCHRRAVARPGQTCPACKKTPRPSQSSARPITSGRAAAVLSRSWPIASAAYFDDRARASQRPAAAPRRFYTTADLLEIHNPPLSLAEAGPDEFFVASALAAAYTAYLNGQPFALNLG